MVGTQTKGKCFLCDKEFAKSSMQAHLKSCSQKHLDIESNEPLRPAVHLVVADACSHDYWLHLLVDATATLDDLDDFLRGIWLECCGHLSGFEINGKNYSNVDDGFWESHSTDVRLGRVLTPKSKCQYTYDYGSSTVLDIKLANFYSAQLSKGAVFVMARNHPPKYECDGCEKPATVICGFCSHYGGFFCKTCLEKHECGDEAEMPIVDSPRTGVCGYVG